MASAHSNGLPIISYAIDNVAMAALSAPPDEPTRCSVCDDVVAEGEPIASGLMLWSRGDELRIDEPPMCGGCAATIGISLFARWTSGEEELS